MTDLEVLEGMRQLLSEPERWTRFVAARDKNQQVIAPLHQEAYSFCLVGALSRVTGGRTEFKYSPFDSALKKLNRGTLDFAILAKLGGFTCLDGLPRLNDHPKATHALIVRFLDWMIKKEKKRVAT